MEEQSEWIFFRELELDDEKFNRFNIDTRDFHAGYNLTSKIHKDFDVLKKYGNRFFYTKTEVEQTIDRLYVESGGEFGWRMLDLDVKDERVNNWMLKYIRIWRTELGFIICNSDHKAIPRHVLSSRVNMKYLNAH